MIISALRLADIARPSDQVDPTWTNVTSLLWSNVEVWLALIGASLPLFKKFLIHVFPTLMGSFFHSKGSKAYESGARERTGSNVELTNTPSSKVHPKGIKATYTYNIEDEIESQESIPERGGVTHWVEVRGGPGEEAMVKFPMGYAEYENHNGKRDSGN